ncbi:MAG TPA: CocE/NonD family hydrolase [Actinomycetota bacterium]|nr:CocE/NonD family hydrolase [Actinomycetota bacterium]
MSFFRAVIAGILLATLAPLPAHARSAPDRGRAFQPRPRSQPLYGTKAPEEDPETQEHYVEAHDGTDIFVETWLPTAKDGNRPPSRIPTVLVMTPYMAIYGPLNTEETWIGYMTARGYAVSYAHVRGTGRSGGCLEQTSTSQIKDGARVVEYLGRDAPWSNGRVGMYGASYDAETQISTAGLGGRARIKYLKAIIPTASVGSQYDWNYMDGVPWDGQPASGNSAYLAISALPEQRPNPQHYPEKAECQDEVMLESANQNGDYTEYWQQREYRPGARRVEAATLMVHGLRDFNVQPITLAGFFDRLSNGTPHKGLFGVWNHAFPDSHSSVEPDWQRADWNDMVIAWFDRYLKGLKTGVQSWPDVQVQTSRGQWWSVDEFPTTGGRLGQLALGQNGTLGKRRPRGKTTYQEQLAVGEPEAGQDAVFETPKLDDTLHVTGQPMLDLWLTTDKPDGHVAAKLEVIGRGGEPLVHEGSYRARHATYGARSLQHIKPMPRGWFEQEVGEEIATDEAVNVVVRFLPTDLHVPRGGRLRLTISGSVAYQKGDSAPSGSASNITLLHNCNYASTLRFRMPDKSARLLNVREIDEPAGTALRSTPGRTAARTGGGLASAPVCGRGPRALPFL